MLYVGTRGIFARYVVELRTLTFLVAMVAAAAHTVIAEEMPRALRVGRAGHAFDHLGAIGMQAEAAAASGATIIYASGVGTFGYQGLPRDAEFTRISKDVAAYNAAATQRGIELAVGYLCATSIVGLKDFDKHWSDEFRAQFKTSPADWRQQDRAGRPLPSWYGGEYAPACMNNPDWRTYQRAMVKRQLECGHDGIFFDNPTVHPEGCFCAHCMRAFAKYRQSTPLAPREENVSQSEKDTLNIEAIRTLAEKERELFMRFRCTIARDFLADMRAFARTINPQAMITCNNSLNSPGVLYSQCRTYGYNIYEMSKAEDFVVVEDMASQPRTEADGQSVEYGSTYKQLHAISRGKPVVAVTIAGGEYHTPPNLVRLAMAEAAANNASYLSWPTWPEEQRARMIAAVRPQADFLRRNEAVLNDTQLRGDVALFLPFNRWTKTDVCTASTLAAALTRANIQYKVFCEDALDASDYVRLPVLLTESRALLVESDVSWNTDLEKEGFKIVEASGPNWLASLQKSIGEPTIKIDGPSTVRAIIHDQVPSEKVWPARTIVHLYNLNVRRLSSFEDEVTPAKDLTVTVLTPFQKIKSVRLESADAATATGELEFTEEESEGPSSVTFTVPRLDVSAIAIIER
jgi:hypothetical protein